MPPFPRSSKPLLSTDISTLVHLQDQVCICNLQITYYLCCSFQKKNLCLNIQIFQEELWWDHQVKFPSSLSSTKLVHILFSFDLVGYVEDDDNDHDYDDYHNEDHDYDDYNDDNGTQGEQEPVRGRSRSRQKPPVG